MPDEALLGGRIREARRHKGLTQERLGELVGVTPQAVSKWENGESAPDINTVPRLCDALGIATDRLLRAQGVEDEPSDPLSKGVAEWLDQHRGRKGYDPLLGTVVGKLVSVVQEAGVPSWRGGDVLSAVLSKGARPTGITLLTRGGSVLHWAGAEDLPGPDVSDDAIANAIRFLADPEIIAALRRLIAEGTSGLTMGADGQASVREHPAFSRLLQEDYVTYHQFADREQVTLTRQGLIVAATILLLAAVPGLGRQQKGRGVGTTLMTGGSR